MTTVANILTNVGYRLFPDGSTTISATSEPNQAECIQWINETCEELLTVCVEMGSEVGRTTAEITLADGTATYTDLAALLFAPVIYRDGGGMQFSGWIEKTNERIPLILTQYQEVINYNPSLEREPSHFYIDGANGLTFIPTPDAEYTAKIPYYGYLTALALTTATIPFMRIFDHVITESVTMRSQNREEYELGFELKWFQYIRGQARKIIMMRKNPTTRISV
jgi:hypothetical protein